MQNDVVILIAEDDLASFTLTKRCLVRAGIANEIKRFADGREILDFFFPDGGLSDFDNNRKYLLLLDIRMPKVDGLEVLDKMKRNDHLKDIPVIIVTTSDAPENVHRCHNLGCDHYIVKPITEKFLEVIEEVCQTA